MQLYTIFDKKAMEYGKPFPADNLISAVRSLQTVLRERNNLSDYPHDFALYDCGEFKKETGHIFVNNPPHFIEEVANLMPKNGVEHAAR